MLDARPIILKIAQRQGRLLPLIKPQRQYVQLESPHHDRFINSHVPGSLLRSVNNQSTIHSQVRFTPHSAFTSMVSPVVQPESRLEGVRKTSSIIDPKQQQHRFLIQPSPAAPTWPSGWQEGIASPNSPSTTITLAKPNRRISRIPFPTTLLQPSSPHCFW